MTDPMCAEPARPDASPGNSPSLRIDDLVDATPGRRNRYVDLLRAVSIAVVVLWHWVFSITHWNGEGRLTMPNPIDDVPLLWAATWVLQIMPVFFIVGGFANRAAHEGHEREGRTGWMFVQARVARLLRPVAAFVGLWIVGDLLALAFVDGYRTVWQWGFVIFVPLWFLGMYVLVIALAPFTLAAHRRHPLGSVAALGAVIAIADIGRLGLGFAPFGIVSTVGVWLFAHQLGYLWRDGRFAPAGRRGAAALAAAGFAVLACLTASGAYSRSMVAVHGEGQGNMNPTSAAIAALAVFQLGLVLLAAEPMGRWLERRRVWKIVVATNTVAMTIFSWHMTALVGAIGLLQLTGVDLLAEPSGSWWLMRPIFLIVPGALLGLLIVVFARFELPRATARR